MVLFSAHPFLSYLNQFISFVVVKLYYSAFSVSEPSTGYSPYSYSLPALITPVNNRSVILKTFIGCP